jgi:3-phosphoglycerate kinase
MLRGVGREATRDTGRSASRRPFGVRTLDDMPARPGAKALVQTALDLPFDGGSPSAALRFELLRATVRDLQDRGASATVFGPVTPGSSGSAPLDGAVLDRLRDLGVEAVPIPRDGSSRPATVVEHLLDSHDVFINDCFQWSFVPAEWSMAAASRLACFAGRELEHNLRVVAPLLVDPERPFTAVLGGDDVTRRLHGLRGMLLRADHVLVGGAMSIPLLRAVGRAPSAGTPEALLDECRELIGLGERVQHHIHLPRDLVVRSGSGRVAVVEPGRLADAEVLDLGPRTVTEFEELIEGSSAVVWTGAVGRVEEDGRDGATYRMARLLPVGSARVVLGGDALTAALTRRASLPSGVDLVTATDPLLELLKTGDLPALAPLRPS